VLLLTIATDYLFNSFNLIIVESFSFDWLSIDVQLCVVVLQRGYASLLNYYSVCERNENPEAKLPEALVSSADAVSPHRCLRDFFQLQNSGFEQMLMVDPVQMISSCHTNALKINTMVLCLL